jgi:hypothetical protein
MNTGNDPMKGTVLAGYENKRNTFANNLTKQNRWYSSFQ